jgi:hypothetical protein
MQWPLKVGFLLLFLEKSGIFGVRFASFRIAQKLIVLVGLKVRIRKFLDKILLDFRNSDRDFTERVSNVCSRFSALFLRRV